MTVQDLINKIHGERWQVTGPDAGQCTAIAHEWEQMLGLPIDYGDAWQTYDNAPDGLYDKELNTPTGVPRPGAIMVWNANAGVHGLGPAGHTAVFIEGDANSFRSYDQNWPTGSNPHIQQHDYAGVKGWFYPKVLNQRNEGVNEVASSQDIVDETTVRLAYNLGERRDADANDIAGRVGKETAEKTMRDIIASDEYHQVGVDQAYGKLAREQGWEQKVAELEAENAQLKQPVPGTIVQPTPPVEPTNPPQTTILPANGDINVLDTIKDKVVSRKFLIAVVAVIYFLVNNDANQALATVLAYIGVQGAVDHKAAGAQ